MQLTFETDRLLLRPRSTMDFAACLAMDRDPEVTKYVAGPWSNPVEHEQFLRNRLAASYGDGLGYWSIFPKSEPQQFLGWILLIPYDGKGPDIEIGWRLNRLSWGKGYATEAARPLVRHSFEVLRLEKIVADIHPENEPSMRVAAKIGMRFVGDVRYEGTLLKSYRMASSHHRTG
ncbi:GNAT family N-acetyltransferase [Phreatobacter sp.]|uniref:GNAT family N-acetyltransferase n=1 Tax=Phreatobacter sp. TaxID=1966341 RepID=UPI003F6F2DDE